MESIGSIGAFSGIRFNLDVSTSSDGRREGSSRAASVSRSSGRQKDDRSTDATGLHLSPEEENLVRELKQRDREVRAHEQAHMAASGGLAMGGANYTMRKGPDGRMYAVGGEVNIDTSEGESPEATIQKARQIRAAANAPANPSPQDRSVAAQASQMEAQARSELAAQQTGRSSIGGPTSLSGPASVSGPSGISGPASSVSGPPQPLNRRVDVFGNPDMPESGISPAEAAAVASEAMYQQRAMALADAQAAYLYTQDLLAASQQAADIAYLDGLALAQVDAEAAYAQTLVRYADPGLNPNSMEASLRKTANMATAGVESLQAEPVDVSRAATPMTAMAAGLYPQDRPTDAIYGSISPVLSPRAAGMDLAGPAAFLTGAGPQFLAAAVSAPQNTDEADPAALQRASRAYQRMGHPATDLAPSGTGISLSV